MFKHFYPPFPTDALSIKDLIYIGGNFTTPYPYLMQFTSQGMALTALGNLEEEVDDVYLSGGTLYMSGDFTSNSLSYVGKLPSGNTIVDPISGGDSVIDGQILGIYVCSFIDAGCATGSVFAGGVPSTSADWNGCGYFDANTGTWNNAGGGANGVILTVHSAYVLSAASHLAISTIAILGSLLSLLFLL